MTDQFEHDPHLLFVAPWSRRAAIAAGGAVGAAIRWALLTWDTTGRGIPWSVLFLNVVGSLVLGVVLAEEWQHPRSRLLLRDLAGIGFCGGLTTFSTFAVEIVEMVRDDAVATAVEYGILSVVLSTAGVVAGVAMLRRARAIGLPHGEAP